MGSKMLFLVLKFLFLFQRYSRFQNMRISQVMTFYTQPNFDQIFSLRTKLFFFAPGPSGVSREGRLRFTAENSILMTQICPASGHER